MMGLYNNLLKMWKQSSSSTEAAASVSSIFIYPIKSCRGISVTEAPLTPTGFRWDRQWVVINSKGRAYTQRVDPKLALVQIELPNEAFWRVGYLLRTPTWLVTDGVTVWEWSGSALDEGEEASEWFTNYLGKPARLVRFNAESETRPVDPNYASGHRVMFSDGYPFMVISQGSMDALNEILKEPVPVNRFRPNILVDGCEPFSEDLWREVRISKFTFEGVKLCSRCKIPTINQETGVAGPQPNQTLMKTRSDKVLRPNKNQRGRIYFGQNLVCKDNVSEGKGNMIKVGDPVYILKKMSSAAEAPA